MYPYDFYEMPDYEIEDEEFYYRETPPFGPPGGGFPGGGFGPGGPFGPGGGFGPGGPGGPGGGFVPGGPGGGFGPGGAPMGPPPSFTPSQAQAQTLGGTGVGALAVDPGAIRRCLFKFTFIWPRRGRGFWAFLTFVGRRSVAGFRWTGRQWVYFGLDLRRIESFTCF